MGMFSHEMDVLSVCPMTINMYGHLFYCLFLILVLFQSLSNFIYAGLLCVKQRNMYILFMICNYVSYIILLYVLPGNGDILVHIVCESGHLMKFVYVMPSWLFNLSFILLSVYDPCDHGCVFFSFSYSLYLCLSRL